MKNNSRIYQLFIILLLIAIGFKLLPTTAQSNEGIINTVNEELKLDRLTINLSVSSLEEIKVREGDKIIKNQIIATNDRQQQLLEIQRKDLEINLRLLTTPIIRPPLPPQPTYSQELAMINSAKANLKYWEAIPEPEFKYHKEYVPRFEGNALIQAQLIAEKRNNAQFTLNQSLANLQRAKSNYQRELYNHQLKLLDIDREERRKLSEAIGIKEKIAVIDNELRKINFISPYTGIIRRIKAEQSNELINVTIELVNDE